MPTGDDATSMIGGCGNTSVGVGKGVVVAGGASVGVIVRVGGIGDGVNVDVGNAGAGEFGLLAGPLHA